MYSLLFSIFVVEVCALGVWRIQGLYGGRAALGLALGMAGLAVFAPLGSFLALLVGAGALTLARQEERRRLT